MSIAIFGSIALLAIIIDVILCGKYAILRMMPRSKSIANDACTFGEYNYTANLRITISLLSDFS